MIELRAVTKRYDDSFNLESTDLMVQPNRTTVLIGPSGCGKSTLLRIMIGLVQPESGTVHVLGERLSHETLRSLRQKMGYVIQEGGLFPHLTARDNVTLMARFLGWPNGRIDARVGELTDLVHLEPDMLDRAPSRLSGGQRQRISLMRALMLDPQVLLLDEPLGALDPLIRGDLQRELCDIFAKLHKTVVMVTHDLSEAAIFASEIVLLRDGRIVQRGDMDDLIDRPVEPFVEQFVSAQRHPLELLEHRRRST